MPLLLKDRSICLLWFIISGSIKCDVFWLIFHKELKLQKYWSIFLQLTSGGQFEDMVLSNRRKQNN